MGRSSSEKQTLLPMLEVVHYADPWCWWSWGLEPIIQRLKEVYGDQIKVAYRTAGFAHRIEEWRKEYEVEEDKALRAWVQESVSLTKNPVDPEYLIKTRMETTWPACIAVKAAQLQGEEPGEHFMRRLMESIQVESRNGSDEEVYLEVAKQVGLDVNRLKRDIESGKAEQLYMEDLGSMNINFLSLLLVNKKRGKQRVVGEVFTAEPYERAVDQLTNNSLRKRTPTDILEYFERRQHYLVTAREVGIVFGISEKGAAERLGVLARGGLLQKRGLGFGAVYWTTPLGRTKTDTLTQEQLKASHVAGPGEVESEIDMRGVITKAVKGLYTEVALNPRKTYHFPVGREAAQYVGYPEDEIEKLPETAVESFAGVGYPHASGAIRPGDVVLDIGSGSGTDVLVASLKTGPKGKVIGLDITDAMIEKARANIAKMGVKNVKIVRGEATRIPLESESVDVVTTNGVLNLVFDKKKALKEIYRVLKPGGRLQIADIVVEKDVQKVCGLIPQLWADCIGGAAVEKDYLDLVKKTGFKEVRFMKRLDYFAASQSDNTKRLTKTFGAESVVITATKPL